ncbi:PREDICTED: TANK-binding kinase 1-binding protein 1, partial [Ficedula albicollis]|uniref:TANK-binding kinase 1-binding protein 1 n=1 Tax=Ficedula albicollis TaxID=59894 RepID=UPI0007AD86A0
MDSMFEDDISILTQEALGPDEDWLDSPNTDLSGEMCSASHFALITAYDDIKNRLTALERENSTLKRRLKMYEVKVRGSGGAPGGELWGVPEPRTHPQIPSASSPRQLQKSKEREEQLEEMIQAYEKLCVEKADLETELGEMVGDSHQRGSPPFSTTARGVPILGGAGSRRFGGFRDARVYPYAQIDPEQSERDMAWVKKVGDDQVNLALAYTELTEELCRLRNLSSLQSQILRA